jgi:polyphenol oxidase
MFESTALMAAENSTRGARIVYFDATHMETAPEPLVSPLLRGAGFRHAFFTRRGGVSRAPFDTLSFSLTAGDDPDHVRENFARAARALGVASERVYVCSQVHGTDARVLVGDEDPHDVVRTGTADVTLTRAPDVACGVRTADCVAVLVGDRATGAVAAIHSGWRGTVQDVTAAGVAALRELIGHEGDLLAAIGPHIEPCCFEVGEDVAADLAACSSLGDAAVIREPGKRPHVDLRAIVRAQLAALGIGPERVDDVRGCTVCEPDRFHSFRRDGARSGRLLSAIVARG